MSPELRHLLDRSKFHKAAVVAVGKLLPAEDSALDALIAETAQTKDQIGFIFVTLAAQINGRPVDARHLADGAMMVKDDHLLGIMAWHTQGDLPVALLAAMQHTILAERTEAAMLFLCAAWHREQAGRTLPSGLIPHARTFCRSLRIKLESLPYLMALALLTEDVGLRAVVMDRLTKALPEKTAKFEQLSREVGELFVKFCRNPVLEVLPAAPPRELSQGGTMRRSVSKVGRNDPCPCGSGRKHKHCCIAKTEERLHFSSDVAGKTIEELQQEPEPHLTHAKVMRAPPHEGARWDPRKLKPELLKIYFEKLVAFHMLDRAVEALELVTWTKPLGETWDMLVRYASMAQRKDLVLRLLKVPPPSDPIEGELPMLTELLLADDDPAKMMQILDQRAMKALREDDMDKLGGFAYAVMASKFRSIGIFVARSMIPLLPQDKASRLFELLLEARDKLNLPPEDPFGDILDERFREDDAGEGKEADALREAQRRLDAKAREVELLKAGLERLHQEIKDREQLPKPELPSAAPAPMPVDESALRELRRKVEALKTDLNERHNERNELRRNLQKAHADLESLRQKSPAQAPKTEAAGDRDGDEEALFLPAEPFIHQPVRIIEFPKHFHAGLASLPKAVSRGTLTMLGRLAAGEPAAFVGVVRLKVVQGIYRQRIGSEFRLLFRLLPDRVQVVDLVPRQDLLRRIKTLQ
jgi:hypothetical protein